MDKIFLNKAAKQREELRKKQDAEYAYNKGYYDGKQDMLKKFISYYNKELEKSYEG